MTGTAQLIVGAITDFVLTLTATLTGAMAANGTIAMPSRAVWLMAVLFGAGAAAKQVRGMMLDLKPIVLLVIALGVTGCAGQVLKSSLVNFTAADAQSAALVAVASKDLLPPGDVWGACMTFIANGVAKLQAGPGLKTPTNGLLTEAMRLHVLRSLSQNIPTEMKASCGQVFLELMLDAGQRMPGL